MLFNSLTFVLFFGLVLLIHRTLGNGTAQKRVLLVASYLFYAAWNPPYVLLLFASTTIDWWLARRIGASQSQSRRKLLLLLSLASNLSALAFFKYADFLLSTFVGAATRVGMEFQPLPFDIILPVGISFYTFASLSYTIDVYRREIRGDSAFLDYALFVSFFPHLVAGPIVRAAQLLPQIQAPRRASANELAWGLALACIGLFCKIVFADAIFAPVVDAVYGATGPRSAVDAWTAVLAFSGQIYYDFSGYSLCAIGLALCFGYHFPDNFRHPYAARGFSDFWRRWHITLSSWLRDYLYVALGGNRRGPARTLLNLMLTMLIGGLWHGASWMFVLWGGLHGLYLVAERLITRRSRLTLAPNGAGDIALTLATFLIVSLTWIPFRAGTPDVAFGMLSGLWNFGGVSALEPMAALLAVVAMLLTVRWHFALRDRSLESMVGDAGPAVRMAAVAASLIAIFLCAGGDERAFLYFQF
jgi:D-alanyl-lipoteichoic acid acyltransferase DltB (MBOAT superfamily)